MTKTLVVALAVAGAAFPAQSAGFAGHVVEYIPGIAPAPGFTNAQAALGGPTGINPFGDVVTPFNPPYSPADIVSVGEGGSLTVEFATPVIDHPLNDFGVDFIIFGNSGFVITNDFDWTTFDWIGIPATDGSLFGATEGQTRVSVSRDGVTFYTLDPALAPTVDRLLPTDSYGNPHAPAHPGLAQLDFAGLTEAEMAGLYAGSAGGAGYDLSWARDRYGRPVRLPYARFVRIEVIGDRAEIDAVAAVFTPRGRAVE